MSIYDDPDYDSKTSLRMWKHIKLLDGYGCWEWTGSKIENSHNPGSYYGRVSYKGKTFYAHRVSYTIYNGPIPEGMVIDHICRNTLCVHPMHLEAVTTAENLLRAPKHIVHGHDRFNS